MQTLLTHLSGVFEAAFTKLGYEPRHAVVVLSARPELGQFQCNGAFAVAKASKQKPKEVAEKIIAAVVDVGVFSEMSATDTGFINMSLSGTFLVDWVKQLQEHPALTGRSTKQTQKVTVDYGGPNVAKPMHVGHLRSTIIGDCLKRLYRHLGYTVDGDIHMGDWGTQMGMLIEELKQRQPTLLYFDAAFSGPYPAESPVTLADLEEMYPKASAHCKTDEQAMQAAQQATAELQAGRPGYRALWQHFVRLSVEALKEDFGALGVHFELWNGESHYHDRTPALLERLKKGGHTQLSKGALIIPLPPHNGKELPPLLLVKSDGAYLYGTSDLATIEERADDLHQDIVLYVVDQRQSLHFQQVFAAARLTGVAPASMEFKHLGFGTVNGPDGKPFKTRAGGVLKLKDLISQVKEKALLRMKEAGLAQEIPEQERLDIAHKVGIAALKFADLINKRTSNYIFDIDRFTSFEGKTGPYLLYTAVRIQSILRKMPNAVVDGKALQAPTTVAERELLLVLSRLPDVIEEIRVDHEPHILCEFAFDLAQKFNRFYGESSIIHEKNLEQQQSWLALTYLCLAELTVIFSLLGIEAPEKM